FASYPYVFEDKIPFTDTWKPQQPPAQKPPAALIFQVSKVGCPIRKSTDQRVFAPPRGLSQRITSFIACACQGIHQLPLRHLIVLIANAHPDRSGCHWQKRPVSRDLPGGLRLSRQSGGGV